MRVIKRWNQKSRPRTIEQMANAVAAAIWKLSSQVVLNLENENFETTTQAHRLDVVDELVIFLVHLADRRIYEQTSSDNRSRFVSALAKDMARMLEESRIDMQGPADYKTPFIEKTNQRAAEYSTYKFSLQEGTGFGLYRALGAHVMESTGARDNKWIPDYIIGREAPEIEIGLRRTLDGLVHFDDQESSESGQS